MTAHSKQKIIKMAVFGPETAIFAFLLGFTLTVINPGLNEFFDGLDPDFWSKDPTVVEGIERANKLFNLSPEQQAVTQEYLECQAVNEHFKAPQKNGSRLPPINYNAECDRFRGLVFTVDGKVVDPNPLSHHSKYLAWFYGIVSAYALYVLWTRGWLVPLKLLDFLVYLY